MKFINLFKLKKPFFLTLLLGVEIITFNVSFSAEDLEARIKLLAGSPARVSVEGRFLRETAAFKDWSFLQNYADVANLGERIGNLQFFDEKGNPIEIKKIAPGEYQSDQIPVSWKYEVKIAISDNLTDAAHVSWLAENEGLLMLEDLLPQLNSRNKPTAKITLELPADWKIATSENGVGNNSFSTGEIGKAVFLVGKSWREKTLQVGKTQLNFALTGGWQFSDTEAFEMAASILEEHQRTFNEIPKQKVQILLLPFPQGAADTDRWRAETRGSTVVIISGVVPLKSVAVQRLHEQLRHEIFHFWIPNGVNLSGNYDWFYEGFTIYHALRTGVELNQIRFEDYLNTLGRGYDLADWGASEGRNVSLLEASQNRWTGANNFIYAKGLVTAFLCDLTLLRESGGKRNLKDVFRRLYQKHRSPNEIEDGNTAILNILNSYPELRPVVQNYIQGKSKIDWQKDLETAGIEFDGRKLKIMTNLSGRQKDLLDKLGYNQWRKILDKKK